MIKVIRPFFDLQDGCHEYKAGDTYPRSGYKATGKRIGELAGSKNRLGVPLIVVESDKEESPAKKSKRSIKE